MRFIIPELPYERPIVAGRLRYAQDEQPTGAVEQFRVTHAVDGYRFWRVDLDARAAPSGRSTLYHLTLNPDGRPEQLKHRFWGDGLVAGGAVVWDGAQLTATREVDGVGYEDEAAAAAFWFPSAAGLALLPPLTGPGEVAGVTLNQTTADSARVMALQPAHVTVRSIDPVQLTAGGVMVEASGWEIAWADQARRVWLHPDGWPLRVWRDDGLTGHCDQLVLYHS